MKGELLIFNNCGELIGDFENIEYDKTIGIIGETLLEEKWLEIKWKPFTLQELIYNKISNFYKHEYDPAKTSFIILSNDIPGFETTTKIQDIQLIRTAKENIFQIISNATIDNYNEELQKWKLNE